MKITFEDERTKFWAIVRPATYRDDLKRLSMQQEATKREHVDNDELIADVFTYPRLVCATGEGELIIDGEKCAWPPTLQDLLSTSVDCLDAWYLEVKRLNPKWFQEPATDAKKKIAIGDLATDRVIEYAEKRDEGLDESFPDLDTIEFNDLEASWSFFLLLETASGEQGWKIQDTLGCSWIDLPEYLQTDLLTWRWLYGIASTIVRNRKRQNA